MRSLIRDAGAKTYRSIIKAADVVALGAALTGNILLASLPAGTRVAHATLHIITPFAGTTTLTASVGVTGAAYTDIVVASDLQDVAGTDYVEAASPLLAADKDVYAHFVATVENLDDVTAGEFVVIIETVPVYND